MFWRFGMAVRFGALSHHKTQNPNSLGAFS
jgi:hypothetical protein